MTNRELLTTACNALEDILAEVKETNALIDAGRISGREDDLGECEQVLENMLEEIARLDFLL